MTADAPAADELAAEGPAVSAGAGLRRWSGRLSGRGGSLLVFALPVLGLIAAGVWSLQRTREIFAADLARTVRLLAAETRHTLQTQQVMLEAMDDEVRHLDWPEIRANPELLRDARALVAASDTVDSLGLTSPDGHIALATETDRQPIWVDLSDRDFVADFHAGSPRRGTFLSAPVISRVNGTALVHISRARITADGMADGGTVVAGFSPAVFERLFAAVAPTGRTRIGLFRTDGVVLARFPVPVAAGQSAGTPHDARLAAYGLGSIGLPRVFGHLGLQDGLCIAAAEQLPDWPAVLMERGDPRLFWDDWLAMMAFPTLGAAAAMLLLALLHTRLRRAAATEATRLQEIAAAADAAHAALVERSALEGRLRQVEKTAALGQLAAGVAHDFNNVLQTVLLGAEALQRQAPTADPELQNTATLLLKAAERGGALTRRMLQFARRDDTVVTFGATDALRETAELINRSFGGRHTLRLAPPPGGMRLELRGSKAEFQTVLINLAVNARDAMPQGGEVGIAIDLATPPEASLPWLCVRVIDAGHGMDDDTLARAGEAFFTTKPAGKGTGLGLSMARGYAERAGGRMEIASAVGRGTTVTLWLPIG